MPSEIKLIHGDCMEFMAKMPDKAFELAIVDPPYGIDMSREFSIDTKNGVRSRPAFETKDWDSKRPDEIYFKEIMRVSNNQIIWGGNYFIDYLFPTSCFLIWNKCNHLPTFSDCEQAWVSWKSPAKIFTYDNKGWASKERSKIHPTQKPVALYKWLLKNYANPGDKILDTHLGSGSIAIACYDMGYDLEGYEIDKDYFDAASKRLENHKKQLTFL